MTAAGRPTRPVFRPTAASLALVATGGAAGAAAREAVAQTLTTPPGGLPVATLAVNLAGALLLGLLLEALVRLAGVEGGGRARLLLGTGFMGAFTTYSTFAVETDLLVHDGHGGRAVVYAAATVLGGLVATTAGIALGALRRGRAEEELPVDPDVDGRGEPT